MNCCNRRLGLGLLIWLIGASLLAGCTAPSRDRLLIPRLDGASWTVAHSPDLGRFTTPNQEPVDFAVWQAADGTWQLWSCIRYTNVGGNTRLFHRWEGQDLTTPDWTPKGIAMMADEAYGELPGGLQAPYVLRIDGLYHMFYGDWVNICLARGRDGKTFERWLMPDGKAGMFSEGPADVNTRDAMVLRIGGRWHCYYTAHVGGVGAVYCRTSTDLRHWSDSGVVARGGEAGTGISAAECPFVVHLDGWYYLFRTQIYGQGAQTRVYRSKDPLNFGIDNDERLICMLPIAAPELVKHKGQWYIASLLPSLKGIQIQRLVWEEVGSGETKRAER